MITPEPTITLIPASPRPTITQIPPTLTLPVLTAPDALAETPSPIATVDVSSALVIGLVDAAVTDLSRSESVDADDITVLSVESALWGSLDFGCSRERLPGVYDLEIEGYRILLELDGAFYAYHTDSVSEVRRCDNPNTVVGQVKPLIEVDPVAEELVLLAKRRVSNLTGLNTTEIDLISVDPFLWLDSSLGCPLPDSEYTPLTIEGYRIVVVAADVEYLFHTSFDQIVRCDPDNEELPETDD
jgi:hypothetical protein